MSEGRCYNPECHESITDSSSVGMVVGGQALYLEWSNAITIVPAGSKTIISRSFLFAPTTLSMVGKC